MGHEETPLLNRRTVEAIIRLLLLVLLFGWCFLIVSPFLVIVAWALILAVAVYPAHALLVRRLRGRENTAAGLMVGLGFLSLIIPALLFADTLVQGSAFLSGTFQAGKLQLPPPPESVAGWPLIGETVFHHWQEASGNFGDWVARFQPQLAAAAAWLVPMGAQASLGLVQFLLAIVIAGVFLAHSRQGATYVDRLAHRLAGERGHAFVDLASDTVRSVAKGVVGVAIIQALLAGIGFLAVGLPGAGLLTLLAVLFCVAQLGPGLIIVPSIVYVFYVSDGLLVPILYLAWGVFVVTIDNVLKPLLLGRGVAAPMLVIFIGAIGGFLTSGFVGLFVGSIVLVLGYSVLQGWLDELPDAGTETASAAAAMPTAEAASEPAEKP